MEDHGGQKTLAEAVIEYDARIEKLKNLAEQASGWQDKLGIRWQLVKARADRPEQHRIYKKKMLMVKFSTMTVKLPSYSLM